MHWSPYNFLPLLFRLQEKHWDGDKNGGLTFVRFILTIVTEFVYTIFSRDVFSVCLGCITCVFEYIQCTVKSAEIFTSI
jgi:hypothetical protein